MREMHMKNNKMIRAIIGVVALSFGFSVAQAQTDAAPQRSIGNGEKNWITTEGVQRQDGTLTFSEVQIDGNGWLVIHPFEDGAINGDKYVASTYVKDGTNSNVSIKVHKGLQAGEMFFVMLHRDVNENQVLDFVFVDELNVMDTAVTEGSRLIGHAIPAP
jgi:hypothetical protein|tara:strand:- start:313 stop:792 length:480 start_codon:yes stop_codon:yes gene_type:complete